MAAREDLLTQEDCFAILRSYTNEKNVIPKSHETKALSSIEGLGGEHYRLKIVYVENEDQKEINLFLKVLNPASNAMKYMIESIKAYEKEAFLYNYLTKEYKTHSIRTSFAPKYYYCRPSIFVFEDLCLSGYKNSPKKHMLDIRHCKVALKTLAQFHASTVLYEKIKSDTDNNYTNLHKLYPEYLDDVLHSETKNAASEWLECNIKGMLSLIDQLPQSKINAEEYKSKLIEVLRTSKNYSEPSKVYKNTVLHGDLWSNNIMFKYEGSVPVHSILIDYQLLKYGPIGLDVVEMIITNMRRKIRDVHYEELLSYYYHQFADICGNHGYDAVNFVSYKEFMASCEEAKILAKIQCLAGHSYTFLTDEAIEEAYWSEEGIRNFLFGDRSENMKLSYAENDLYREIITEDLIELRDLLFKTEIN